MRARARQRWSDLRSRAQAWIALARLLPAAGPAPVLAAGLLAVVTGVLPMAFALAMARTLQQLVTDGSAGPGLAIAAGALTLGQVLAPVQSSLGLLIARRVDEQCGAMLIKESLRAPLARVEQDGALDLLADVGFSFRHDWGTPGRGAAALFPLGSRYLQLASALTVLAGQLPWFVVILVGLAAQAIRRGQRGSLDRFGEVYHGLAGERRRFNYLSTLGTTTEATKEIRLLRLGGWLEERHRLESERYLGRLWRARRRIYFWPFVRHAVVGAAVAAVAFTVLAASPGDRFDEFSVAVSLQALVVCFRFGVNFPECDVPTQYGLLTLKSIRDFGEQVRHPRQPAPDASAAPLVLTGPPEIRLEGVRFGYPSAGHEVLRDLDLVLPAGTSTALVGLNGAGKTTVVKLLTGLYRPDHGRLTVNGVDLASVDPRAWHRHVAVILQNFLRYELTLRDNVTFGAAASGASVDDDMILRALERADAAALLADLPDGLDTVLSPVHDGGVDLSGGQWQRIALARCLLAVETGAGVLILDEPTAQLDVRAEAAFYERFLELTSGLTTVIISHRFATIRRVDGIAVLADGRITERGTHGELLDHDGAYARLYRLQAQRFHATSPAAGD